MVMMIIGGALLPPLLGAIADNFGNIAAGYIVPLISFAIVFLYSIMQRRGLRPA
jgi:FHS family L-fucose permease-like MFS transporter